MARTRKEQSRIDYVRLKARLEADPELKRRYLEKAKRVRVKIMSDPVRKARHLLLRRQRKNEYKPYSERAEYFRKYQRDKRGNDPGARIANALRCRLRAALRGVAKAESTLNLLGCTVGYLIAHIESQWDPEMSWANYGRNGWTIDHIRPCASFDLTDPTQLSECCNFRNLQPMWHRQNQAKGARWNQ